ncbi:MAG: yobA [Bradyrhizobium sp.]|jgi:methionine-rich copper-binding protein CopC|nr:yobA [Bradyrhizobium sp.]MEA2869935.1 copper resistance protein [Bradyrhizobium sp.]
MSKIFALAVLMCVASSGAASAHAHLVSSEPVGDAVVHIAPRQLKLTFSEALEPKLSGVTVSASGKGETPTDAVTLADSDAKTLIVTLPAPLAAGTYTVGWHALSKDGHATQSSYSFAVAP